MKCAGIHRGLGVHVSKVGGHDTLVVLEPLSLVAPSISFAPPQVRSVTLDTWLPHQVAFMQQTGNAVANAVFEAKLDLDPCSPSPAHAAAGAAGQRPDRENAVELQRFIRRKMK